MNFEELKEIKKKSDAGILPTPPDTIYVNNHIHTTYSFSPYSPTEAVYYAWKNGLKTCGIMDHDSASGIKEFIEAGKILNMPVTCGVECRVSFKNTKLNGKRINNPDQISVAYVTMHGIPHQNVDKVDDFFKPYREKRNIRNKKMCERITELVSPYGLSLDFEKDVLPVSNFALGGSVTERHILFALTKKITSRLDSPEKVVSFLENDMKLSISSSAKEKILNGKNTPEFYEYDILGVLKSNMVEKFYIDATDECPDVKDFVDMVHKYGGVAAYAYLGDVGNSVTGDKKTQKFEDDYLDLVIEVIKELGFDAVTYMPTRNTPDQLERLMKLCEENSFFQISGEDINSPRQSFICKALDDKRFAHLIDATYTLIAYENEASIDVSAAKKKYTQIFG